MTANRIQWSITIVWALLPAAAQAEDRYYAASVEKLAARGLKVPAAVERSGNWRNWRRWPAMRPYAVLDVPGEAYVRAPAADRPWQPTQNFASLELAVRAPTGKPVTGRIVFPKSDLSGMASEPFTLADSDATPEAKERFLVAKEDHYQRLLNANTPGGAFFRYQVLQAQAERTGKPAFAWSARSDRPGQFRRRSDLEQTYEILSGGRAIAENLQLDRPLNVSGAGEQKVPVDSMSGITVAEFDWSAHTAKLAPKTDPLARYLPADQHAVFFPTFDALVELIDEADSHGTPIVQLAEEAASSADARGRYERQLCVSATALARLLGPTTVASVALTGSDPYLRTGADVALLFEARQPAVLKTYLAGRYAEAVKGHAGATAASGTADGIEYTAVRSPDRAICSYSAKLDNVVVVTNSLEQLRRLVAVQKGSSPALAALPEYVFFRDRYRLGEEETAFIMLSDATIRRWCGPRWRIGSSRRTRAAAVLADLQARHASAIVQKTAQPADLTAYAASAGIGTVHLTPGGVWSETYGTLGDLTPIVELDLHEVTKAEADAYERFRDNYQRNWRQFFDPIAIRLVVRPERLQADMTVMPLIAGTEYRRWIQVTQNARLAPEGGDRHPESLLHVAVAIDPESPTMREARDGISRVTRTVGADPLAWLGNSVGLFVDDDPFWQDLAKAEKPEQFVRNNVHRLPLALRADVKDPLKLAVFLTTLRAFIEQTAPGLTQWDTLQHGEQAYVRIRPQRGAVPIDFALYYAVTPRSLILTVSEAVLKRTLDRQAAQAKLEAEGKTPPTHGPEWLGDHLAVQAQAAAATVLETLFREEYQATLQLQSWNNLVILNEWKRLYPDRDPLDVHERLWQARLLCPGGGKYVWNEQARTMESTVYGSPVQPKLGVSVPRFLAAVNRYHFGLTFENAGLRARGKLERKPTRP